MTINVANAPCSWGVLEFEGDAPLSAREFLSELRKAGFDATELGDPGFLPTEPTSLAALLTEHEVALVAGFLPVALSEPEEHAAGIESALRVARLLAALNPNALVILSDENGANPMRTARAGRIGESDTLAPIQWRYVVHAAGEIARIVREETGLRTAFHPHCAGWVETPVEVDRLMTRTDPELLGLCFDTGHWTYAGGDAVAGLEQHRDRIWHVHLKDCSEAVRSQAHAESWDYFTAVKHGIFCELGTGGVDFEGVTRALEGWSGYAVVEQDVLPGMGTPLESAQRNREFLHSLGL